MSKKVKNEPKALKLCKYETDDFILTIPDNWLIKKLKENQRGFIGPKIGKANMVFVVTKLNKKDSSLKKILAETKKSQAKNKDYQLVNEKDISGNNSKAVMRRSTWFHEKINNQLLVREIYTETKDCIYALSLTIPNNPKFLMCDDLGKKIMQSFKIRA